MAMSKKNYEAIAAVVNKERSYYTPTGAHEDAGKVAAIDVVAFGLAEVFRSDNPKFDTATFYRACGMEVK